MNEELAACVTENKQLREYLGEARHDVLHSTEVSRSEPL